MRRFRPLPLLLAASLAGCSGSDELVVVNSSAQVITALFGPDGADLLRGAQVPPGDRVTVELPDLDTAGARSLEAYNPMGACAARPATAGRWVLSERAWDLSGCDGPLQPQRL